VKVMVEQKQKAVATGSSGDNNAKRDGLIVRRPRTCRFAGRPAA
jgi:hypothetical protein